MKKIIKLVFLFVIVFFVYLYLHNIKANFPVTLKKWEWMYKVFSKLNKIDGIKIKICNKLWKYNVWVIQEWTYYFSWSYSCNSFFDVLEKWPKVVYKNITILEWRSSFDIDYKAEKLWFINQNEYINFINDKKIIWKYSQKYSFLKWLNLKTLEWFLYPDTYKINISQNFTDQLVYLQLETFNSKFWKKYKQDFYSFKKNVKNDFWLDFSLYDFLKLASIIEKEEKNSDNKPIIAWIFLNRLQKWMLLWADITLCYGLEKPYETCTPSIIWENIYDKKNIFNTRQKWWLTPVPISNPSISTLKSLLNYKKTDYLYYLHDLKWGIHYWKTLKEHNSNKNSFL